MLPLHLATGYNNKDAKYNPNYNYIVIMNGYAYATDAHILIKVPVNIAFPEISIAQDETFMIDTKEYEASKIYKNGAIVSRDGDRIINESNFMFPVKMLPLFTGLPKYDDAIPLFDDLSPCEEIGIDPLLIDKIGASIGLKKATYKLIFHGKNKAIDVLPISREDYTNCRLIFMPCFLQ